MAKKNDGGPAFPVQVSSAFVYDGMSLRDWFAGQALAGMLAYPRPGDTDTLNTELFARDAYDAADAMLKERVKDDN